MSSASANSNVAKTSKKEVKKELEKNIRVVGGPLSIIEKNQEYSIEMNPEYIIDFATPMMELSKSVGNFTGYLDANGKIVKRVDNETGKEYNLNTRSVEKAVKKSSKTKQDEKVTIVSINDKAIKAAKKKMDEDRVSNR